MLAAPSFSPLLLSAPLILLPSSLPLWLLLESGAGAAVNLRQFVGYHRDKTLKGKSACTRFLRISTNGTHSVVLCKPVTGRTHQIRVHLQHCGHPIANDDLYLSNTGAPCSAQQTDADSVASIRRLRPSLTASTETEDHDADVGNAVFSIDPLCTNCPFLPPKGYGKDEEGIWLHCMRYSGPGWSYECPSPEWAVLS
ncbi:RNA pseudouridine synthase 7 [Platanthera guangdongensis]|uniref:RNA pseudouridine synthase 7 n=1 Tax=Platanthera guangdongensis TaxID=2320717 RepID=A0ABR2MA76_9ASPA